MANREVWSGINESAKKLLLMTDTERISLIRKVLDLAGDLRDQAILVFFYLYGMRPEELLEVKKLDFSVREEDLVFRLPTVKEGRERVLILNIRDTPFLELIVKFINTIPIPEWRIFREFTDPTNFNKAMSRLEKRYLETTNEIICLSPYVFRKFRMSYLFSIGASSGDLLAWKGGKSMKVVEDSYTILKPVVKWKSSIK
jgi:integrase